MDLFYSFIVIQHFETIEILKSYLDLISRKLKENGTAVLWYAKLETSFFGDFVEIHPKNLGKESVHSISGLQRWRILLKNMVLIWFRIPNEIKTVLRVQEVGLCKRR